MGSNTFPALGGEDGILLRYNAANGVITSGKRFGGTGYDRVLALAREYHHARGVYGWLLQRHGQHSGADHSRTPCNGLFDGFLTRITNSSGARLDDGSGVMETVGSLIVWPNPASRQLWVEAQYEARPVHLLDAQGKLIPVKAVREGSNIKPDVSGLKAGIYLIRSGEKTARFVKE